MPSKPRPARPAAASKKPKTKPASRTAKPAPARAAKLARPAPARSASSSTAKAAKSRGNGASAKPANGKRAAAPAPRAAAKATPAQASAIPARPPVIVAVPTGPSPHDLAVEVFERGFRALQVRHFREAADILASILERYPDEKELHERVRVYIAICERQCDPKRDQRPRTVEERINAATVALNRGAFAEALEFLSSVKTEDTENDAVCYMLAVAHAGLGDADSAVSHLHEAIELNPDNRFLAAQDSDLEALREHAAFVALLDSPPPPRRRTASRTRSTR